MKTILLLVGIAGSLFAFVIYTVSGSLMGKDTRSRLPKWICGAVTLLLGGYFALVEWDSFVSAWNRHILGQEEPATAAAAPRTPAPEMWSLYDMSTNPTPIAATALVSETDPRLFIWCDASIAAIGLSFYDGTAATRSLQRTLRLESGKTYRVTFRLEDGRLMILDGLLDMTPDGAPSFNIQTFPADPGSELAKANDRIDALLHAIMVEENDFTVRIGDQSANWIGEARFATQGISVMWTDAAQAAAAAGGADSTLSAECRAAMAG